ncbi:MAG: hypothetical protein ACP5RZ_04860 [Thermoplasmata archaeon]
MTDAENISSSTSSSKGTKIEISGGRAIIYLNHEAHPKIRLAIWKNSNVSTPPYNGTDIIREEKEDNNLKREDPSQMNINISQFKEVIIKRFPDSLLSKVLKAEPDEMTLEEFMSMIPLYLRLSRE